MTLIEILLLLSTCACIFGWVCARLEIRATHKKHALDLAAAVSLIDGAYDIVEIWKPEGPYNTTWKQQWLERASELGASSSI